MKIGFDLDEVLASFLVALIEYHNAYHGTSLVREEFRSYRFWETWGGTREEAVQKVYEFYMTPYFRDISPVAGSQEAIGSLKQDNDLFIVTSRQDDIAEATREWVAQHFPDAFSDIFFANHYSQYGSSTKKSHICNSAGIDVLIEDSTEFALECLDPKRKVLLMDCPWNREHELPQGVYRVSSWKDILSSF